MKTPRRDLVETVREATKLLRLSQNRMTSSRSKLSDPDDLALWDRYNESCADLGQFDPEFKKEKS